MKTNRLLKADANKTINFLMAKNEENITIMNLRL
jgi:hypothetical protein